MRAVVLRQFGPPSLLKIEEVPTPKPNDTEVLVAIKAASINPSDVKNVQGVMHGTTLPRIPGRDFAGVVVAGPKNLLNQEVWGTGGDIGFTRDGTHAEYILLPKEAVTLKPKSLSMNAAASAGVTYVTAFSALITAAQLQPNETILIIGATGGVGSAALQIAKSKNAHIIAVVRSEKDISIAQQLGAHEVINSAASNLAESIKTKGINIAFDTTGSLFAECVELLAPHGRLPIITSPPNGQTTFNLRNLYRKQLHILGVDSRPLTAVQSAALLQQMSPQFESGQFEIPENKTLPLTEAPKAYEQSTHGGPHIVLIP